MDLGAGTGKLTRVLLEQGHDVVAVEPDPLMRARLVGDLPGGGGPGRDRGGGARCPTPRSTRCSWRRRGTGWTARAAAAELARVLRPGGGAVLLWNVRDLDDPLAAAIRRAVVDHAPELAERAGVEGGPAPGRGAGPPLLPGRRDHGRQLACGCRVPDLLTLVSTWSYVALSPARDARARPGRRRPRPLAAADGTVVVAQHVEAHRFRRA